MNLGDNLLTAGQAAKQIFMHATTGGIMSVLQGGEFGHGFASAGVTKGFTNLQLAAADAHLAAGAITAAIIGGSVSQMTGGKFANGANTAAMQFLLNAAGDRYAKNDKTSLYDLIDNDIEGFYEWLHETNPVEHAAWQQYASDIYLEDGLTFDQAVRNFAPFARQFARDRYKFLSDDLKTSVYGGYGKDMMSQGMTGLSRVPYIGNFALAGSVGLLVENNVGTILATRALTAESRELTTIIRSGPQVFRVSR